MAVTDDDELVPDEVLNPDDAPAEPIVDPNAPPEDPKYAALKAELDELKSRPAANPELGELVALGKQYLASQAPPGAQPTAPDPAALKAFGEKLQSLGVTGDPSEYATMFLTAINDVAGRQVQTAAERFGTPLVEKAGQFAVQAFLSHKKDQVGATGEKLHQAIAKDFKLTPEERTHIATATVEETERFLNRKYRESAGDILLASSSKARPRNLSGGTSGGGGTPVGGLPPNLQAMAEAYWPDPAVRAAKLKAIEAGENV